MLLRAAQRSLARLLIVVLLASLIPPFSSPAIAAAPIASQYRPSVAPVTAPLAQPMTSTHVPQISVTPRNQTAHAALPPIQRPIGQRLPLTFVPNSGRIDSRVLFQAQGMGGQLFFTQQAVVIALPARDPAADRQACERQKIDPKRLARCRQPGNAPPAAITRLDFVGANPNPTVVGADRLPGVVNRLQGNDPAQWRTQLATYTGIVYQQLYAGINLRYDGVNGQIKSTYTVAAGADPSRIRWRYQHASDVQLTPNGDLQILLRSPRLGATAPLTLTEQAPVAWQVIAGQRRPVSVRYSVGANRQVSFTLGSYNRTQPLIIDPTLTYSTYLGGTGYERGEGIAVDSAGNSYVVGMTYSTNLTNTNALQSSLAGSYDAFVTKLSPDGQTVLFSTYLGGSANDAAHGVAVDASGTIAIVGSTNSSDFPTAGAAQSFGGGTCGYGTPQPPCADVFVAVLDSSGSSLTWSTFLGGSQEEGSASSANVAVDSSGNVYVTGNTASADFPTTSGAYDTTCGTSFGCSYAQDAFVTKLAASDGSLSWSTYLGGDSDEGADGIAVDTTGHAYVVGSAGEDSFLPSSPRAQHYADVFIVKFTPSGDDLVYGTYLGGSDGDSGEAIAVDSAGSAYVTGETWSPDFPLAPTGQALQSTWIGPNLGEGVAPDLFVTKLNPAGDALIYSTFLGGSDVDYAGGIAVDQGGRATIVGETGSDDFFAAPNDFPTVCADEWCNDAFIATLTADGRALRFGSYLGGDAYDGAMAVAEDATGNIFLTGFTYSDDFRTANPAQGSSGGGWADAFVAKISNPSIGPDEQRCACGLSQPATNNPVNTRTGNYWTSATDLGVLTPGPAINWSRVYASQAITDTTGALSPGWQYPYATHIITPTTEAGRVIVLSELNNRERFASTGASYDPFPGVSSTLVRAGGVFTQTLRDQQQLVFDAASGTLIAMRDAEGRRVSLTYSGTPARLTQIADAADGMRYLGLTYTGGGQIATVSDGTRTITYTYTLGDLTGAQDVIGHTTSYTYTSHLLTQITNPLGQTIEQMQYDSATASAKVTEQWLQDGQHLQFQYLPNTTVITTTGADTPPDVQRIDFAPNNAMVGMSRNGQTTLAADFDDSFSPSITSDGNGNVTHTTYSANGLPLRRTDALGQTTRTEYDAQNRPVLITDTLGVESRFLYDPQGNVISTTVGITDTNPIGATSIYTYSYDVRYSGDSQLQAQSGPDGVISQYAYNTHGQVITSTLGYGTALAQTTTTEYDALGRAVAATSGAGTALARTDRTIYNADSTVASTIQNYQNGIFDAAHPDQDVITTSGYDALGRQIWTRDALGHYDVTHYNAAGQVDWSARNFSAPGWSGGTTQPASLPTYTPTAPDANVATLYGYDGLGRTALLTQTGILTGTFNPSTLQFSAATTRVTKTEYDALSRPITTTLDVGGLNVQALTYYDGAGNVAWQRDALGRWTKTDYDALSRPITTTVNYEDGDPLTGLRDADLLTVTHYDSAGRVDQQINNAVDGIFTATEPITDRVTLSAYDTFGRVISTTLNYAPGESTTDLNRMQMSAYDPATMRVQGQRDALGRWVSQQYDLLGRVSATVQNCRDGGNTAVATGCAAFSPTYPDRNVPSETRYDALGRAFETEDALGHVTHTAYDGLGRAVATTQNYVFGGSVLTDTNVTTRMAYDALGHTLVMTDALGYASHSSYNGLGQSTLMTDTLGRVTTMGYDGSGALRWSKRNDGQITVYQIDGLGRTIATIASYQDGTVGSNEPADRDLITRTIYDAAGRRTQTIDPAGQATAFAYDSLDRLIGVTEHAVSGSCTQSPCNVITQYQYDRAGNRTAIIDANSHVRRFSYDAADQPAEARDALDNVTSWDYDAQGRVTTQHDPRGTTNDLSYSYDNLDRLTQRSATNLGTIDAQYDALGRRTSLADGTGTTSFGYDNLGRMRSVQAPNTGHVGYDYDARGMRTKLIYPDGTNIQYGYAADGQLHVVTGTTTLATYSYDSAGRLQAVARTNGATTTYGYDSADRLADLATTVSSAPVSDFAYQTDRLGQRTVVTETLGYTGLVADIQSGSTGSSPSVGVAIGVTYFFSADDGSHGSELWKSDGTANGTLLVKDIVTGSSGSLPANFTVISATLFFTAYDATNGIELWKSDGTASGTVLVKDIVAGSSSSFPSSLIGSSGTLFFTANDGVNGTELWKSDGTASGTVLVKDIWAGSSGSLPTGQTAVNGVLFFAANDGTNGTELWKSDGTTSGTVLVKDIRPGSSGASPVSLTAVNGMLFFAANDGTNGTELWKSDGTSTGTVLVKDIRSGSSSSSLSSLVAVNGMLFFAANDGTNGTELWKSDGTSSGTVLVKDVLSGSSGSSPSSLKAVDGPLFFVAFDSASGQELWLTDSTGTGTVLVKDIRSGFASAGPSALTAVDNRLFFTANDGTHGQELWVSDGSAAGTVLVKDIVAGSGSANPTNLRASDGRLFFAANDGTHGQELWTSMVGDRVVQYSYDGLQRLTGANESPGASYAYSYDDAGNRTGVWLNGTQVVTQTFNAANQIDGFSYDAAGNLIDDGTATYGYDALGRMTIRNTTPYTYTGDGALVDDGTTRYTQDLAAPLSQILQTTQISTTDYLYGLDRLAAQTSSTKTWYVGDALGSVRMTLDDTGTPLSLVNYDPWGTPESGSVPTFGFTGELQDAATGLVNLRARWYATGQGRFVSRDPFTGWAEVPKTLAPYNYTGNDPINHIDPSGHLAIFLAGGFGVRPTTGPDVPGVWLMAQKFKDMGIIPGETIISDAGGHGGYTALIPSLEQNDVLELMEDKIGVLGVKFSDPCYRGSKKREPIILVGHSRGAATIQQALGELYRQNPDIRVDLVVTLGLIPGIPFDGRPTVDDAIKQPNVDRHINLQSQAQQLFGGPTDTGLVNIAPNERNIAGADMEKTILGTEHNTLDDETFSPTCTIPSEQKNPALCEKSGSWWPLAPAYNPVKNAKPIQNEAWTIIEQAIREVGNRSR